MKKLDGTLGGLQEALETFLCRLPSWRGGGRCHLPEMFFFFFLWPKMGRHEIFLFSEIRFVSEDSDMRFDDLMFSEIIIFFR